MAGHLVSDPVQKQYRTDDLNLKIGPTTFVLKMAFKQEKLDYHYDVQLHAESLDFSTLSALNPEFEKNLPPEAQIKGSSILTANLSGNKTQIQTTGFLDFEKAKIIYGNYFKKGDQVPARIEWSYYGPLDTILTSGTFKGKMKWQDFFVLEKYEPENFQADFHLSGKKMVLDEMSFKLFDGSLLGKGFVDFENKSPSWQFDFKAAQIDFNSLMTVTGGFRDIVSGKGDMALALSGIGSEMKEIKQSASGDGNLSVSAGKISIVNIAKEVLGQSLVDALNLALTSSAGMGGAPKIAVPRFAMQTQETNFNSFAGGFRVENGFIQLPDTKIISESAVIGLTGKTSLDGDLDLKGNFLLSRQETDQWLGDFQGKSSLVDSEGKLMVPFTVSGALTTPLIKPDVSQWTEKLKGSVIQNLQPKIEEKLPAGIQKSTDKLKEIFH
ncbi:MAG: AsmA-like C-terminal region-containing protein [Deltaproteobacteria bacterium]|nr:MAG: AsmA-like C-terminal region-containing protein [Deltaproteobacteria bacterium]